MHLSWIVIVLEGNIRTYSGTIWLIQTWALYNQTFDLGAHDWKIVEFRGKTGSLCLLFETHHSALEPTVYFSFADFLDLTAFNEDISPSVSVTRDAELTSALEMEPKAESIPSLDSCIGDQPVTEYKHSEPEASVSESPESEGWVLHKKVSMFEYRLCRDLGEISYSWLQKNSYD